MILIIKVFKNGSNNRVILIYLPCLEFYSLYETNAAKPRLKVWILWKAFFYEALDINNDPTSLCRNT